MTVHDDNNQQKSLRQRCHRRRRVSSSSSPSSSPLWIVVLLAAALVGCIAKLPTLTMAQTVDDPEIIVIDPWQIPAPNDPYLPRSAEVGDVIRFVWENNHNVFLHPSGDCNETGSVFVGQFSPSQYVVTEADAGTSLTFACNVGSHCEFGQIINVTVTADTEAPTGGPTAAPIAPAPVAPEPTFPPTNAPTTASPTVVPTAAPTVAPTTEAPTAAPTTAAPVVVPTTPAPTVQPTTVAPTVAPVANTTAPTAVPSAEPVLNTTAPSAAPVADNTTAPIEPTTMVPSDMPSSIPTITSIPVETPTTAAPSVAPTTTAPVTTAPTTPTGGTPVSTTLTGLRMGMAGIGQFPPTTQETWTSYTGLFSASFIFSEFASSVTNYSTSLSVTSFEVVPASGRRQTRGQEQRQLQQGESVIVVYDQVMNYETNDPDTVTPELLATDPFATTNAKSSYVTFLGTSGDTNLEMVSGVSNVIVPDVRPPTAAPVAPPPTDAPTDGGSSSPLSTPAIIGIACGGGALLILAVLYFLYCRNRGGSGGGGGGGASSQGKYQSDLGDEPPLQVSVQQDEVSTLAGPQTGPPTYGDQSVATIDYDYSKAYGGAGDTSVSSAGGTFGSNTQNNRASALDPASAAATGAALGSLSEGGSSFEAHYHDPNANVREEVMHIFAPPGKLGVVIDTPDDGAPVVHAVKDSSVIASKILVGDKLVAVDDEDVRSMTAIKVSKLISRKSANPSRKLTIVRTTVLE